MNLNQVTVPSRDLPRAIAFYKLLGLRLIVRSLPDYARFECPAGEATFSLHRVDALPTGEGVAVYFETPSLDDEYARLRTAGITFELPPTNQRWRWREARLRDPDGNRLILFYAGADRKDPPWRIDSE